MKLWASLYAMTWITLIEFLLVMTFRGSLFLIYLHTVLGIAIVGLAFYNFSRIRKTRIASRVKRIAQTSFNISIAVAVLGVPLFFDVGRELVIPLINVSIYRLILFFHVFSAFAIITQAAAIAIAHDMWENREFTEETEPGSVPSKPKP
jgi:hypothetical protein